MELLTFSGQIELYTHSNIMRQLVECLHRLGYRVCGVYLLDSQFVQDSAKFFAGVMSAMSAMLQLGNYLVISRYSSPECHDKDGLD